MLWLAVVVPFVYSTARNASDISAGTGFGPLELLRGAGPAVLWGLSILMAPTMRRGFGVAEVALSCYCVVIVTSVLIPVNPSPQGSLLKSVSTVFVFVALTRLVRMYDDPGDALVALVGFVHVVLLAAALQLVLFHNTVYSVEPNTFDGLARLNIVVPSVSANPLALLGVAGVVSCVVGVAPRWLRFNVVVRNALLVLYGYEIYLTRTRTALAVGLLVVTIALALRVRRHLLSTLGILAVVIAGAVTLLPAIVPQLHSFLQRGQTAQGLDTLSGRTVIWHAALTVWHQNSIFGLGYYTGHRLGIPGLSQVQSNIDNTWLETLVDVGIVGLVPLALFAIAGLARLFRTSGLSGDRKVWAVAVAVYVTVISFINPTIQQPGPGQVVLAFLLLVIVPTGGRPGRSVDPGRRTQLVARDLPAGAIASRMDDT
jgi:O-antigen ligase